MAQRLRAVLRALQPERAAPAAAVDGGAGAGAGAGIAAGGAAGGPKPLTDGQLKDWVANGMAVITIPEEELPASVHSEFYRKAKAMADGEVRRSRLRPLRASTLTAPAARICCRGWTGSRWGCSRR